MRPFIWAVLLTVLLCTSQSARAQFQQGPKLVGSGAVGSIVEQGGAVALSGDGNTAIVGASGDNDNVGAAWIFIRSGGAWTQQAKLLASSSVGGAWQGTSVALSSDGNTAIVGGPGDSNNAGAAWVFTRGGTTWTEQAKLVGTVTGQTIAAAQGWSVALSGDGNTAIIGGPADNSTDACPNGSVACSGAAWVFTRSGSAWTQQQKLFGTGATGLPQQGFAVALSSDGNRAIVGGWSDNNGTTGAAWIFTRSSAVWTQQGQKLVGSGAAGSSRQGWSVALSGDGNTAMFGGPDDNHDTGAAWVFAFSNGTWNQQAELNGPGAVGKSNQGWSVSLSNNGNTAIIGGWNDNSAAGAAWVFTRSGGAWSQQAQKLVGSGAVASGLAGAARQGSAVALSGDGNTVLVGGPIDNNEIGAAWAYIFSTTTVALASSVNPSSTGQSVTFTATVAATGGTPTGTVTFYDGATSLGSGTLSSGTAMLGTASLSAGSHSITAVYSGDGTFMGATSPVLTQTVNQVFALTVSSSGSAGGTVTSSPSGINCGSTCSASFASGTQVTLTATPASGWGFSGWGGACSGTGNCVVTLNAATSVTASFAQFEYTLTISVAGNGTVNDCATQCIAGYSSGTTVSLTATPTDGATFIGWGGACTGNGSCQVTMNSMQSVTAMFSSSSGSPTSRTWVSATLGSDSYPCTRTAPCLTFAVALALTTAGGEIDVLDPGDFGPMTITKSISIEADEVGETGVSTGSIVINAGANDVINLRGLVFDGFNQSSESGVVFNSGAQLNIRNCLFQGFSISGITFSPGAGSASTAKMALHDVTIINNASGILVKPGGDIAADVSLDGVDIDSNNGGGLRVDGTGGTGATNVAVADSSVRLNASNGINAVSGPGNVTVDIIRVVIAANGAAGIQANQSKGGIASVTVGSSVVYDNNVALEALGGASLLTYSNNQVTGNIANGSGFTGGATLQ